MSWHGGSAARGQKRGKVCVCRRHIVNALDSNGWESNGWFGGVHDSDSLDSVGGVTAGIDFALTLVSLLHDQRTAEAIQLRLEYNPAPPFNSGSPDTAPPEVLAFMKDRIAQAQIRRGEMIDRAAARMT